MSGISKQLKLQHLYLRTGFGESPEFIRARENKSIQSLVDELFQQSKKARPLGIVGTIPREFRNKKDLTKEEKRELRKVARQRTEDLNFAWLTRLAFTQAQLREKMTLFWHGHFACRVKNPIFSEQLNDEIRKNALGNFQDLVLGVSRSPAMLQFLNNQQNRKAQPNENFARELMELFTLGRDQGYTETDIKEAARAFTGWGFKMGTGEFVFRKFQHDTGSKTFKGKTGNWGGEDIIRIILEDKQTAKYITRKLYRYFVNENRIPEDRVNQLAEGFFASGYNIETLMREIFSSDWFYDAENVGAKIKSPIELLAGLMRSLKLDFEQPKQLLKLQRILGQALFYPPNVAGWPGGKTWIDSSTLSARLSLPGYLFRANELDFRFTDNLEDMTPVEKWVKTKIEKVRAEIDWDPLLQSFAGTPRSELIPVMAQSILQTGADQLDLELIYRFAGEAKGNEFIKNLAIQLYSLPEFQLC